MIKLTPKISIKVKDENNLKWNLEDDLSTHSQSKPLKHSGTEKIYYEVKLSGSGILHEIKI